MTSPSYRHAHHYPELIRRWRSLAQRLRCPLVPLAEVAGEEIWKLETGGTDGAMAYLSAGVHGDEAAAAWGLLHWAESNEAWLLHHRCLILPCLNPHGLRDNVRMDHQGRDLNRCFHQRDDALLSAWHQILETHTWRIGICLHEDYDGQGCYVYELGSHRESVGRSLLEADLGMEVDPRRFIDGRRANAGVIWRRRVSMRGLAGLPEAVALHQYDCPLTLTFETPSESGWDERVRAHRRFIEAALARF